MTYDATKLPSDAPSIEAAKDNGDWQEPITLQQAKDHLRVVVADEDDYIAGLIIAARQMAEGVLNRTLVQRTRREMFDAMDTRYVLRRPPVVSVDAVTVSGIDGPLASTDYEVRVRGEDAPPELQPVVGSTWTNGVARGMQVLTVDYTAGYAQGEVPNPIIQWMLLAIGTMYENRESVVVGAVRVAELSSDFNRWLLQPYLVYE